jgi:hypothetical protein
MPAMWCGTREVFAKCVGRGQVQGSREAFGLIYFIRREHEPMNGQVWLLFMYAKSNLDSIAGTKLKELKDAVEKTFIR